MKIANFNIDDIDRLLTNLLKWLVEAELDIVCFQGSEGTTRSFRDPQAVYMQYGAARSAGTAWRASRGRRRYSPS